ncbi:dihydropteroate synthase [Glaciecola sp. XM2]|uniref:dihydropteroate synthase n=1 Tax=Glaciecola sp. XM2 TaxID=1914931 RepID=UPI001BDE61DD|nr:dihydropteroate synthase [Glaciecola sp. XM2]MBT1452027.1 dihydropteroate synthase [Glaciecola sp. XM2]
MTFRNKKVVFDAPKVMGILNVTPDSFSDGGKFDNIDSAISQCAFMCEQGATFIDVGGESTRPGATPVGEDEELSRVIPVIDAISKRFDVIISVDTSKATVMSEAAAHGAGLINDVRALSQPGALETAAELAAKHNIPSCIMHMQGTPLTMQNGPQYDSVVDEVVEFFRQQLERLTHAGFHYKQIMLDPGFGFGKTLDHNYQMLKHFIRFTEFDLPVMAGMSRKSMIGDLLNKKVDDRIAGDVCVNTLASMSGASVLRVHDVKEAMDVVKIIEKINQVA